MKTYGNGQGTTGWTAGVRFLPGTREFSFLHSVQTGCGAYSSSYTMGTGGVKLTTELHIVPRSKVMELYLHSPCVFMVWSSIKRKDIFTFSPFMLTTEASGRYGDVVSRADV
jgi:hypothetical protein